MKKCILLIVFISLAVAGLPQSALDNIKTKKVVIAESPMYQEYLKALYTYSKEDNKLVDIIIHFMARNHK